MSTHLTRPDAYADLGDVWLRDQQARLTQKRAQFGRHYRMDADALMAQLACIARAAKATAAPATVKTSADALTQGARMEAVERWPRLNQHTGQPSQPPSRSERWTMSSTDSNPNDPTMPAFASEFVPIRRLGVPPRDEWSTTLHDNTEIIVLGAGDRPCPVGVAKAVSIVQSRTYLEAQARRLLVPLTRQDGEWRLARIDFGLEAQHLDCEFLMCFTFQKRIGDLNAVGPYVEVGFALPAGSRVSQVFTLVIQTAIGLDL